MDQYRFPRGGVECAELEDIGRENSPNQRQEGRGKGMCSETGEFQWEMYIWGWGVHSRMNLTVGQEPG